MSNTPRVSKLINKVNQGGSMTIEERQTAIERDFERLSKLLLDYSNISLEHTKTINKLVDRVVELEKDNQDREVDIKVAYSKIKDLEKNNAK